MICGFGVILPSFFINFFHFVTFSSLISIRIDILWVQLILVFQPSFLNYAYLFYMVWRCVLGFGVILPLLFINFFHLFDFFRSS